jgi:glycosyltransferase involved in cell wall biosynthesis
LDGENQLMKNASFITSWPLSPGQGSGTALFVKSLQKAVNDLGDKVNLINPKLDTSDYVQFTLDRLWFNVSLSNDERIKDADWILGLDYDGFALTSKRHQRFFGTARAVFADLVDTEPEPFRSMLKTQAYFEGHNLRKAEMVFVPSSYAKRKVSKYYNVNSKQIYVIPNGINLIEWDQLTKTIPEAAASKRPTVLAVSKLYPRKKISTLIRATPAIRSHFPEVDVRVVGGGFEWNKLHRLSEALGVTNNITWLGDVNDRRYIVQEFHGCHVFTHPSIQDAFANVCLESMAASKPLVVSDAAAMPDLVKASHSGLIVPPEDPQALADAIIALLDDESKRIQFGRNGRKFAEQMTWEKTAQTFIDKVYD